MTQSTTNGKIVEFVICKWGQHPKVFTYDGNGVRARVEITHDQWLLMGRPESVALTLQAGDFLTPEVHDAECTEATPQDELDRKPGDEQAEDRTQ